MTDIFQRGSNHQAVKQLISMNPQIFIRVFPLDGEILLSIHFGRISYLKSTIHFGGNAPFLSLEISESLGCYTRSDGNDREMMRGFSEMNY